MLSRKSLPKKKNTSDEETSGVTHQDGRSQALTPQEKRFLSPGSSSTENSIPKSPDKYKFEHLVTVPGGGVALKRQGYQVIRTLGRGAYSKVFEVLCHDNQKRYACKFIQQLNLSDRYNTKFWPEELKVMQAIDPGHPNIIRTRSIFEDESNSFMMIIMNYCEHGMLSDKLGTEALLEAEAKRIMVQVFRGLSFLHDKKIAHRDLKLENILLDKNDVPKLADFSYSIFCNQKDGRPIKGTRLSKTFCGTPCYFAPEILQNKPYDPLASDVWSIAVCLYILTNNTLPFEFSEKDSRREIMLSQQLKKSWSFKNRYKEVLSSGLYDILSKMLEPSVKRRHTMTQVLQHSWCINAMH